ncbi:MAG TPA: serine hydrolase, partial [Spirochaetia bacterium]|nr:serine hydrolase [Spirochaetia bacterium]
MSTTILQCTSPEAQGIPSAKLLAFVDTLDRTIVEPHGFVLLRHGSIVAKGWWSPHSENLPHMLFSLTKSFVSTAVGFAVFEGRLSIDDSVTSFFPDKLSSRISRNLAAMRVRDLLTMSTGHATDPTPSATRRGDGDWVKGFFAAPVTLEPGVQFLYNSAASHVLSALVQKVTGQTLMNYLTPRLFAPLGIHPESWETDPHGITIGGWGLMLRTEEVARFGQLLLQRGAWNGQQVLPSAWVMQASSSQVSNRGPGASEPEHDWNQGYGFQFWRCRHGCYRGDGAFGQFCIVFPEQDAVLAMNNGVAEMHTVLNAVWDKLLPAFEPAMLPEDPDAQSALRDRLSSLGLSAPPATSVSPVAPRINGVAYRMEPNETGIDTLSVETSAHGCTLCIRERKKRVRAECAYEGWHLGDSSIFGRETQPLAGHAAWIQPDTLRLTLRKYVTPFVVTFDLAFKTDQVVVKPRMNVNLGPTEFPSVRGTAAPARSR